MYTGMNKAVNLLRGARKIQEESSSKLIKMRDKNLFFFWGGENFSLENDAIESFSRFSIPSKK